MEGRRFALERCVSKMASHPVLSKDADLRFFLESDSFALDVSYALSPPTPPVVLADNSHTLVLERLNTGVKRRHRGVDSWPPSDPWPLLNSMKWMRYVSRTHFFAVVLYHALDVGWTSGSTTSVRTSTRWNRSSKD